MAEAHLRGVLALMDWLVTRELAVVVDNQDAHATAAGSWEVSGGDGFFGADSLYSKEAGATFTFSAALAGPHRVDLWWSGWSSRCDDVAIEVRDAGELLTTVRVDQSQSAGQWVDIGAFTFAARAEVVVHAVGEACSTCADAVRFVPVEPTPRPDAGPLHDAAPPADAAAATDAVERAVDADTHDIAISFDAADETDAAAGLDTADRPDAADGTDAAMGLDTADAPDAAAPFDATESAVDGGLQDLGTAAQTEVELSAGCQCRAPSRGGHVSWGTGLLAALALAVRRSRRRGRAATPPPGTR